MCRIMNLQLSYNIYTLMFEYLILNGKFDAAKHLNNSPQSSLREQLISLFNKGNRVQFLQIYSMLHKQSKLQFYLRVYFLIYTIHPALKAKSAIPEAQKVAFKDYLDNKGAQLAKTNEFLEFYALPFIKKPLQHLAFKNLFKKQWITNLKQKLQMFITQQQKLLKLEISKVFQQPSDVSSESRQTQQKVRQMQKINKKLFQQVKQFTQKYHILQDNHKAMIDGFHTHMLESQSKWFQITKQLVQCSKSLIQMLISTGSECLSDRRFFKIKRRTQKYQKFVSKKFDDLVSHSEDISIFDKASISQLSYSIAPATQKNFTQLMQGPDEYVPTDFLQLRQILKKGAVQQKIAIINGLYWRLMKSKSKQTRKLHILGILHFDILGINTGDVQQLLISRTLLKPVVRLLQLISLDNFGKKLAFTNNLLKDFIGLIHQCQDPSCFEYIISTLGQISSQKRYKNILIKLDIIQACVKILRDSKYSQNQTIMQNTVAIMLNMLEKTEALRKYQRERDIFQILKKYLKSKFRITRTLICGIIFALLESQQLFKRAHVQKLPEYFDTVLTNDPTINKTQLKYLKNKLAQFQPKQKETQQQDDQLEDNQQQSDIQIQHQYLNQLDEVMKSNDQVLNKYLLKGKQASQQTKQIKQLLLQYKQNRLPRFNNLQQSKPQKMAHGGKNIEQHQSLQTPNLKQISDRQINRAEKNVVKKINNYFQPENKQVNKQRNNKLIQKQRNVQLEDQQRRMKKSVSADRGINKNNDIKHIYQSNKFNKISQFKSVQDRQYRSPQQKKPRQQVLKQLNQQIKAEKNKVKTQSHRENMINSHAGQRPRKGQQYTEVFQSRPKLRRTPPRD